MAASIAALNVYPVKSCRGIALESSPVGERGLAFDREWMIVDDDGRFVTQRDLPRLALIEPSLTGEALELSAPWSGRLAVPLHLAGSANSDGMARQLSGLGSSERRRRGCRHLCNSLSDWCVSTAWFAAIATWRSRANRERIRRLPMPTRC
jgi:hypothetical protein